ncbi:hypothetical protein DM02DRAFT_611977 [Periconia macrospinosa]|uniref:SnoaL-like domain-containing protein n=1 Tax=Periconia macrospinosa TaxID=97972 RepID=A0A2V1DZB4_9PLEO|nr:hypothetical protein DM02DRAFT_611977 [Periconia macrospinosa]
MVTFRTSAIAFLTAVFTCQTDATATPKLPVAYQAQPVQNCPPSPVSSQKQAKIFQDFLQTFLIEGNITKTATFLDVDYIQHNPYVLSGRQSFLDAFGSGGGGNSTFEIVHTALQNNIAWVHYKNIAPGSPLTAVVDVYRFNGSCIMEHWDVIQSLPADAINPLALF